MNSPSVEDTIAKKMHDLRSGVEERVRSGEEYVRQQPLQGILWAVIAGYVLRLLPLSVLLSAVIRLALAALRPLAFLYVLAKGWEILNQGAGANNRKRLP